MRAVLRDVAQRAGVCASTASRILNDIDSNFAPDTRLRVLTAAAEIGYRPNWAAKALSTGRTQTLALLMANIRSSYSLHVINTIRDVSMQYQYDLIISVAKFRASGALDTSRLMSWPIDGVFAIDIPRFAIRGLTGSMLDGKPFVSMGRYPQEDGDHVLIDFRVQVLEGVRHLHAAGRQRIAFLAPHWIDGNRASSGDQVCIYEAVMADLGLPVEIIMTHDDTSITVIPALESYIRRKGTPDGIFCLNGSVANGAFRVLREFGLRIPEDVALVGCAGTDIGAYLDPPLTTVTIPVDEMCAVAWRFLRERIENPSIPIQQITLPPRLDVRNSSLRPCGLKYASPGELQHKNALT